MELRWTEKLKPWTSGVWRGSRDEELPTSIISDDERNTIVAKVSGSINNPQVQADMRIIEVAPEMASILASMADEHPRADVEPETIGRVTEILDYIYRG